MIRQNICDQSEIITKNAVVPIDQLNFDWHQVNAGLMGLIEAQIKETVRHISGVHVFNLLFVLVLLID